MLTHKSPTEAHIKNKGFNFICFSSSSLKQLRESIKARKTWLRWSWCDFWEQTGCLQIRALQSCPFSKLTDWFDCVVVFRGLSALLFNTLFSMYELLAGLLGVTWWQITRVCRGPEAWLERALLRMQGCAVLVWVCRHMEISNRYFTVNKALVCDTDGVSGK